MISGRSRKMTYVKDAHILEMCISLRVFFFIALSEQNKLPNAFCPLFNAVPHKGMQSTCFQCQLHTRGVDRKFSIQVSAKRT